LQCHPKELRSFDKIFRSLFFPPLSLFFQETHLEVINSKHVTKTSKTPDSLTLDQVSSMISATPRGVVAL
jgi:hypothetical protein